MLSTARKIETLEHPPHVLSLVTSGKPDTHRRSTVCWPSEVLKPYKHRSCYGINATTLSVHSQCCNRHTGLNVNPRGLKMAESHDQFCADGQA